MNNQRENADLTLSHVNVNVLAALQRPQERWNPPNCYCVYAQRASFSHSDRAMRGTEVKQWQTASWLSRCFSPALCRGKTVRVKAPPVSGCSSRTRARGGPSPGRARPDAPASSRRTLLGHRLGSGAWTAWQWTHDSSCGRTGCPGRAPSRQDGRRLLLDLQGTQRNPLI